MSSDHMHFVMNFVNCKLSTHYKFMPVQAAVLWQLSCKSLSLMCSSCCCSQLCYLLLEAAQRGRDRSHTCTRQGCRAPCVCGPCPMLFVPLLMDRYQQAQLAMLFCLAVPTYCHYDAAFHVFSFFTMTGVLYQT